MTIKNIYFIKQLLFILIAAPVLLLQCHKSDDHRDNSTGKAAAEYSNPDSLVVLNNEYLTLKILPFAGGRIVSLERNGGENILKTDESLWNYRFKKPLAQLILNRKIPFNGHIVWVGPQSEWWTHQDINEKLKESAATWPPDPYLIYGNFKVVKQRKNFVELRGPKSKYTGVQLTKKIKLGDDGEVYFNVEAENISPEEIAWDLWLNTRMDGFVRVYVPINNKTNLRVKYRDDESYDKMPYEIKGGYFYFKTKMPVNGKNKIDGKAFIYPDYDKIFAFKDDVMFVIQFRRYAKERVHPDQGLIEIYNSADSNGESLMELEYHTPYEKIKPGSKISGYEIWEVVDYKDGNAIEDQIRFINLYRRLGGNNN